MKNWHEKIEIIIHFRLTHYLNQLKLLCIILFYIIICRPDAPRIALLRPGYPTIPKNQQAPETKDFFGETEPRAFRRSAPDAVSASCGSALTQSDCAIYRTYFTAISRAGQPRRRFTPEPAAPPAPRCRRRAGSVRPPPEAPPPWSDCRRASPPGVRSRRRPCTPRRSDRVPHP